MLKQQKILVIGGTGFIGSHVAEVLVGQGHQVSVLSRQLCKGSGSLPFEFLQADLYKSSVDTLAQIFQGFDGVVYAAGVDERVTPKGDVYQFFARKNIQPMERVVQAAKRAGVNKMVLMNSIFSYLERTQPSLKLADKHPYIRSRVDQRDLALECAGSEMAMYVFEVPYVFGGNEKHPCQWRHLIDYIRMMDPLFVTDGGANMLHVNTLANAAAAAICNDKNIPSGSYEIGDENLTWGGLFERLCALMGIKKRNVIVTENIMDRLSRLGGFFKQALGMYSGLDDKYMAELVTKEMFFDARVNQQLFGFEVEALDGGFLQVIQACPEQNLLKKVWAMAKL